jgi:hypothetical protein
MMCSTMSPRSSLPDSPVLRPVRAGQEITVAVEGGFARRLATGDGLMVELPDRDLFLPVDAVIAALRVLGRAP